MVRGLLRGEPLEKYGTGPAPTSGDKLVRNKMQQKVPDGRVPWIFGRGKFTDGAMIAVDVRGTLVFVSQHG